QVVKALELGANVRVLQLLRGSKRLKPRGRRATIFRVRQSVRPAGGRMRVGEYLVSEYRNVNARVPDSDQNRRQVLFCVERDFSRGPNIRLRHVMGVDVTAQ